MTRIVKPIIFYILTVGIYSYSIDSSYIPDYQAQKSENQPGKYPFDFVYNKMDEIERKSENHQNIIFIALDLSSWWNHPPRPIDQANPHL